MGIDYLLPHDAMPDLVKIGRTETSLEDRMKSLNNASVPFSFRCFYATEVVDAVDVEKRLHQAFEDFRVGKGFFELHPIRAQRILEMVAIRDATPKDEVAVEEEEEVQLVKNEQRRHLRSFSMFRIGLKVGDVLTFARNESITAMVSSDTEITFDGAVQSPSSAVLAAIHKCGYNWKTVPGSIFWMYNGQSLKEIEASLTLAAD